LSVRILGDVLGHAVTRNSCAILADVEGAPSFFFEEGHHSLHVADTSVAADENPWH
jgi:hypothetical protein